jgi:hypothetical protein
VPGVQPHVICTNELGSLEELLTSDVVDHIVEMINAYAEVKLTLNRPARRKSAYNKWYPVTKGEFYNVLAILISGFLPWELQGFLCLGLPHDVMVFYLVAL